MNERTVKIDKVGLPSHDAEHRRLVLMFMRHNSRWVCMLATAVSRASIN